MNTVQRVAKNAVALFTAKAITAVLGLVLSILVARNLGVIVFGKYNFALAFTGIFAIFLNLGFDAVIVRDVARDKSAASRYIGNIAVIRAILSAITFGVIALIITQMDYPHDTTIAILIFGLYIILIAFGDLFRATFRAFEKMEYDALGVTVRQFIITSLGLAAIFLGYGLIQIAYAFAIGGICYLIVNFLICSWKFAKPKLEIDLDFWKKTAKVALPISFTGVAFIIYTRIDTVMLSVMKGDAVVGWYNAAYNLVLSLNAIPVLFMGAVLPLMASSFISSPNTLKIVYQKSLRYLLLLGLPIAMGTMLLAGRIIPLFYGDQFAPSIVALQILSWDILLLFFCSPLANMLISINRQNQMAAAAGGCVLINITLNLIFIPHFNYIGAATATIATEVILFGMYFYLVSKYFHRLSLHKMIASPLIACLAMGLFLYFCQGINLAVLIIAAAALYFAVLYMTKGISKEDIDLLKQAIKPPKLKGN